MTRCGLIVATRNPGKLREIGQVLADLPVGVGGLEAYAPVEEPAETGQTFAENAREKALYYARATGRWCLADDSGLEVRALGGAPGIRSARYAAESVDPGADRETIDAANNAKLLAELARTAAADRGARFVCHLALADPQGILIEASGTLEGQIATEPRGHNGFGYDPLFFLPEMQRTTAELTPDRKNAVSHRGKAVRAFAVLLKDFLASQS